MVNGDDNGSFELNSDSQQSGIEASSDETVEPTERTPEENRIYQNKLEMEIEKHREKLLMLNFELELMQKELRDLFVDNEEK